MFKTPMLAAALAALAIAFAAPAQAGEHLADLHVKGGMKCETCHGNDMKNPQEPTTATCTGCHNVDQLVDKTKGIKPTNPHTSPHYGKELDCTNCHLMHMESENFCNQCHEFDFKVP